MNAIENYLKTKQELLEIFTEEELKEELKKRECKHPKRKAVLNLLGLPDHSDAEYLSKKYGSLRR
ncbi:MAG TPA: hypothetical protein PKV80_29300 [Leptospiraceae bacterium]|nr:hypothetical protein [Leptospiraceae bacterium]